METFLAYKLPDDQQDYDDAINGHSWRRIVEELDEWLREQVKYGEKQETTYTTIRNRLWEEVRERSISLND